MEKSNILKVIFNKFCEEFQVQTALFHARIPTDCRLLTVLFNSKSRQNLLILKTTISLHIVSIRNLADNFEGHIMNADSFS